MLWLLEVEPGHRVLDVGAGSGWTTALLATLVGATGLVVGVELEEDLAKAGSANLARTQQPWASIRTPDPGVIGDPGQGPYDRILVSAMAIELPIGLTNQMAPESVLVIPVGGRLMRIRRAGELSVRRLDSRTLPIRSAALTARLIHRAFPTESRANRCSGESRRLSALDRPGYTPSNG